MTNSADQPVTKPPGPRLSVGIALIVLGIVMGIGGIAEGVSTVVHSVLGPRGTAPANFGAHLSKGTWQVYVEDDVPELNPIQVTVVAPDQRVLTTSAVPVNVNHTLTVDGISYVAEVRFSAPESGTYHLNIAARAGDRFVLSKTFSDIARTAARWFALTAVGFLVGLLGIVLLIVGISRRRSARTPRPPAAYPAGYQPAYQSGYQPGFQQPTYQPSYQPPARLPPPGWYPDPSIPGTSRWWDGTKWSDQTQPG